MFSEVFRCCQMLPDVISDVFRRFQLFSDVFRCWFLTSRASGSDVFRWHKCFGVYSVHAQLDQLLAIVNTHYLQHSLV